MKPKTLLYKDVTAEHIVDDGCDVFAIWETKYSEGAVISKAAAIALAKWILKETKPKKKEIK
jgi:hypothetical protein